MQKNNKKYDVIAAFDVIEHFNKNEIVTLIPLIFNSLPIKGLLKNLIKRFIARLLLLDPSFINSANIIGVGVKNK
ncbi:MAG: hypothetical protein QME48_08860 [bacterium]|nr:hypothetical protein [bacterium]